MGKQMRKRIASAVLIMALMTGMAGSVSGEEQASEGQDLKNGVYRIYYANPEKTELVQHEYPVKSKDFDGILKELLDAFGHADTAAVISALPEQVQILSAVPGINEIDVDFNAEYLSLDPICELLLRAGLVKTLLQIRGVDKVRFTVESQSLMIGEEEIGPMTDETFIIPEGKGINSYREAELILYFPAGDGTSLKREVRSVYDSSNLNKERLVIEQMLKGTQTEGLLKVAVEGTLVQDVSVSNGYCIVDFSEEINNAPAGEVIADSETVLYAFTNAIIESCTEDRIIGVRFRIEGSSDVRFRDQVNLDRIFNRNAEIIAES